MYPLPFCFPITYVHSLLLPPLSFHITDSSPIPLIGDYAIALKYPTNYTMMSPWSLRSFLTAPARAMCPVQLRVRLQSRDLLFHLLFFSPDGQQQSKKRRLFKGKLHPL